MVKNKSQSANIKLESIRGVINKDQVKKSYKKTLSRTQSELNYPNRLFSKFIHNSFIESTSDLVAITISRPNAFLFGSITAFLATLTAYITSKTIGYDLSGSETIFAFAIGWIIGNLFDYFKLLFTGKAS